MACYYRFHFRLALRRPEHLETIIRRLRANFTSEGILKGRAIEDRLVDQTWLSEDYDLLSRLGGLQIPALIIHGDHDLVPVEWAAHVAGAIPGAWFVLLDLTLRILSCAHTWAAHEVRQTLLEDCGHLSYLECPDQVGEEIRNFFHSSMGVTNWK